LNCRARKTDPDAKPLAANNVTEVEQFVSGLMKKLVGTAEVDQCIKDAKTIDSELQTAIAYFKKKDI
jgi:hypothetical protein